MTNMYQKYSFSFLFISSFIITVLFFDYHLLAAIKHFGTFVFESGEFKYDRLINLSIAKYAEDYGPNFVEPFGRQYPVFYQFFPYWVVGIIAKLFSVNPWAIANVSQLILPAAFFGAIYWLAKEMLRNRIAALLATLATFFFGSLEAFLTKTIGFTVYGNHAVILTFTRATYGFYLDMYSVLFGCLALAILLNILRTEVWRKIKFVAFGVLYFLCFNIHFLPALLFTTIFGVILLLNAFENTKQLNKSTVVNLILVLVGVYIVLLYFFNFRLPLLLIAFFVISAATLIFILTDHKRYILWFAFILIISATIPVFNIVVLKMNGVVAFDYSEDVRTKTLGIPFLVFVFDYFPVILLALYAISNDRKRHYGYLHIGIFASSMVWIFNDFVGYNNHPYRYIPYAIPLLVILGTRGAVLLVARGREYIIQKDRFRGLTYFFVSAIATILIGLGILTNILQYKTYARANDMVAEPQVTELAASIEKIRQKDLSAVFFVSQSLVAVEKLTPYTSARFFYSSNIGPNPAWMTLATKASSFTTIIEYKKMISDNHLRISYLVIDKNTIGVLPSDILASGDKFIILKS